MGRQVFRGHAPVAGPVRQIDPKRLRRVREPPRPRMGRHEQIPRLPPRGREEQAQPRQQPHRPGRAAMGAGVERLPRGERCLQIMGHAEDQVRRPPREIHPRGRAPGLHLRDPAPGPLRSRHACRGGRRSGSGPYPRRPRSRGPSAALRPESCARAPGSCPGTRRRGRGAPWNQAPPCRNCHAPAGRRPGWSPRGLGPPRDAEREIGASDMPMHRCSRAIRVSPSGRDGGSVPRRAPQNSPRRPIPTMRGAVMLPTAKTVSPRAARSMIGVRSSKALFA